jgi:hypothetical protein
MSVMTEPGSRYAIARGHIQELCAGNPEVGERVRAWLQRVAETLEQGPSRASVALHQERQSINGRIHNFAFSSSAPYRFFEQRGWTQLTFPELVAVGEVIGHETHITMDREAKRRKPVLFKWLDDNWSRMKEYAEKMELFFDER